MGWADMGQTWDEADTEGTEEAHRGQGRHGFAMPDHPGPWLPAPRLSRLQSACLQPPPLHV